MYKVRKISLTAKRNHGYKYDNRITLIYKMSTIKFAKYLYFKFLTAHA